MDRKDICISLNRYLWVVKEWVSRYNGAGQNNGLQWDTMTIVSLAQQCHW
jgi:hypothetical protein